MGSILPPIGRVLHDVYGGECLKSYGAVCSLVWSKIKHMTLYDKRYGGAVKLLKM